MTGTMIEILYPLLANPFFEANVKYNTYRIVPKAPTYMNRLAGDLIDLPEQMIRELALLNKP